MLNMETDNQIKIIKLNNLSEAKTLIKNAETNFNNVRHSLIDAIELLMDIDELTPEIIEQYPQIETELFHITKFLEKMRGHASYKNREIKNELLNLVGEGK